MITQALQAEDHNAIFNYFGDRVNLKRYHTRLLSLMSKRDKLSDLALESLVDSIYNLRCLDPGIFEEALRSLEEREADMIREIMQQADENAEMLQREQEELEQEQLMAQEEQAAQYEDYGNETEMSIFANGSRYPKPQYDVKVTYISKWHIHIFIFD